jgi:hypothetical protein
MKLKKSDTIKLSNIDYVRTLAFNKKYDIFENVDQRCFSLNLRNNEEFMKIFS